MAQVPCEPGLESMSDSEGRRAPKGSDLDNPEGILRRPVGGAAAGETYTGGGKAKDEGV